MGLDTNIAMYVCKVTSEDALIGKGLRGPKLSS